MSDSTRSGRSTSDIQNLLRKLPGVDAVLEKAEADPELAGAPRSVLLNAARQVIGEFRDLVRSDPDRYAGTDTDFEEILPRTKKRVKETMSEKLVRVINATGIVVHTNLGRSLLAEDAARHVMEAARRYSNLEFDLSTGKRGSRYSAVEDIICEISGAESAMVVNNNAGAVLLALDTVARNREVIVSRGELVEIGGSFRIPDVMAKSGGILKEVGATNRTHISDYRRAVNDNTGLLLKVHTSNYAVVGFTASVSLKEMVGLGAEYGIPVMEDLGSGTFVDFQKYGLVHEPTVQESVAAGIDIITFSGDKLLGGPQGGIIIGSTKYMNMIKKNPLTRALRIDKLTLAALESTLRLYRQEADAIAKIPTLYMLTSRVSEIDKKAAALVNRLESIPERRFSFGIVDSVSKAGGGSLPLLDLPTRCVWIKFDSISASRTEMMMRRSSPPVIGRIEEEMFLMDMRTVLPDEIDSIFNAINYISTKV